MASRPREQAAVTAAILGRRAPAAAGRGEGQREHRWDHTHPWDCSVEPEVARGGSATRAPAVAAVRQQPPARIGAGKGRWGMPCDGEGSGVHGSDWEGAVARDSGGGKAPARRPWRARSVDNGGDFRVRLESERASGERAGDNKGGRGASE